MARPSANNNKPTMDTSYLSQQVNSIIGQLHGLFDEIGVPGHERESREAEVCRATTVLCTIKHPQICNLRSACLPPDYESPDVQPRDDVSERS